MKALKIIGDHLKTACVYFTVAQLFITALFQLSAKNGSKGQFLLFDIEIVLLGFSAIMAVIQDVFKIKRFSFAIKFLMHFLLFMLAALGLFSIVMNGINNVNSLIYIMVGFAMVYAVVAAVVIIVRAVRRKNDDSNKEYKPMFEKKENK